jgi:proline dehydrogenase
MARRFVAGETIDDGIAAARELVAQGFNVSLDYLGESVKSRAEARAAADTYVTMLERIGAEPELRTRVNVSLKLTQMGQDIRRGNPAQGEAPQADHTSDHSNGNGRSSGDAGALGAALAARWQRPPREYATPDGAGDWDEDFLRDNVKRILDTAKRHDIFVRFDMEGTPHTQRTLDFFLSLWQEGYRNTGVVLQSYLRRSEHDVREANQLGARVRLCKGAYMESEQYAFQEKAEVDSNYIALMKLLLDGGNYPGIATHDDRMIDATREFSRVREISPDRWEFQMLYGIRRDLQHQLIEAGYNLRVYVPFGDAWYPYLMRRMAERPANLLFIVGSVLRESPLRFLVPRR